MIRFFCSSSVDVGGEDAVYLQPELFCKLEVAFIMRRHGHDGAGAVTHQDIIGHPDGDLFVVDRIDGIGCR